MSELTSCNYCSLNRIRQQAKQNGMQVTLKLDEHNWTSVYVHPSNVTELLDEYRIASMMKITNHCVC